MTDNTDLLELEEWLRTSVQPYRQKWAAAIRTLEAELEDLKSRDTEQCQRNIKLQVKVKSLIAGQKLDIEGLQAQVKEYDAALINLGNPGGKKLIIAEYEVEINERVNYATDERARIKAMGDGND